MAPTEDQRAQTRLYLGYERAPNLHPRLESRWGALTANEGGTQATTLLGQIAAIDTQITNGSPVSATATATGHLKRVEDVEFHGAGVAAGVLSSLYGRGRMLIRRLAVIMAVEVGADYFDDGSGSGGGLIRSGDAMALPDDLLPLVESLRGLPGQLGFRPYTSVAIRTRTWTGAEPGDGTSSDVTLSLAAAGNPLGCGDHLARGAASAGRYTAANSMRVGPLTQHP